MSDQDNRYGGGGSVRGWIVFLESPEADFTGTLNWTKPPLQNAKYYSNGFAVARDAAGSRYRPPTNSMDQVLTFSAGRVGFSAGNLASAFEEVVSFTDNKVTSNGTNRLTISISLATGLFSGSVTPPGAPRSMSFRGALYQKLNYGAGFFLGTDQSGRVHFSE